jgi:hypothetical protein
MRDAFIMLRRNHNGMNPQRGNFSIDALIFHGNLSFCIRLQPRDGLRLVALAQPLTEQVCEQVGQRDHFCTLVGRIADHQSLVSSAHVLRDVRFLIQALVNLRALLVDVYYHRAVSIQL